MFPEVCTVTVAASTDGQLTSLLDLHHVRDLRIAYSGSAIFLDSKPMRYRWSGPSKCLPLTLAISASLCLTLRKNLFRTELGRVDLRVVARRLRCFTIIPQPSSE